MSKNILTFYAHFPYILLPCWYLVFQLLLFIQSCIHYVSKLNEGNLSSELNSNSLWLLKIGASFLDLNCLSSDLNLTLRNLYTLPLVLLLERQKAVEDARNQEREQLSKFRLEVEQHIHTFMQDNNSEKLRLDPMDQVARSVV